MRRLPIVLAAFTVVTACELAPPVAGRACSSDRDCDDADAFYCQLEVEPHVCLPQPSGVPPLPNHAPILESALIVVASRLPGEPPTAVTGRFRARDPDGDEVSFRAATVSSALGTLVLEEDGSYVFTLASPPPEADEGAALAIELLDDRAPPAVRQASALVYHVAQSPSPQVKLWQGDSSAAFDDDESWLPAGAPRPEATVLVGPLEPGPLQLEPGSSHEVNGWLSSAEASVSLGSPEAPATLHVRGTRLLSGAPLAHGTVQLTPPLGFGTEVTVAGELPTLVAETQVVLAGAVHARGDVRLRDAKTPLQVGSLVIDGDLTEEGGMGLLMTSADAALSVGGDLLLSGATSTLEAGLLVVGGDLDVTHEEARTGPFLRTLFTGGSAASEEPQAVRLSAPDAFRFRDAVVARASSLRFESDAFVDGELTVMGAVGVAPGQVVQVGTLILRPSLRQLDGPHGELRAGRCLVAVRVELPAFVSCDHVLTPPPEPDADAGVVGPEEPDAGPPASCPDSFLQHTNDLLRHSVIVASAAPPIAVSGALDAEAAGFSELDAVLRTGSLHVAASGALTFAPSGVAGHDEVPVTVERDNGIGVVETDACADVYTVDTGDMNVLVGALWDDPASWSRGHVPTSAEAVFVPASDVPHEAAADGAPLVARDLFVASGAVLDTRGRDVRVGRRLIVGGELRSGAGVAGVDDGGEVAGRVERLACTSGVTRLAGDVSVEGLVSAEGTSVDAPCGFDLGRHRFTVTGDVTLAAPLELRMQVRPATFVVEGALKAPGIVGLLEAGEVQLRGDVDVATWSAPASLDHQLWLMSAGALSLARLDYDGWLLVMASEERFDENGVALGDTPLVVEEGGQVGMLTSYRTIDVLGGELVVDTLQVTPLFDTSTPERWRVTACVQGAASVCP